MGLSARTRFEIFKRDTFTCQYCGRNRDEDGVKLHVDHIVASANGGTNDEVNLVTACQDCNLGKSSVPLNIRKLPDSRVEAERLEQLARLEENRLRVVRIQDSAYLATTERWESWWRGWITYPYPNALKAWIRDFGVDDVLWAIDKACEKCDSSDDAVKYLAGIFRNKRDQMDDQEEEELCFTCNVALAPHEDAVCDACMAAHTDEQMRREAEWLFALMCAEDEIGNEVAAWDRLAEAAGF